MKAYKWLDAGALDPKDGFAWPQPTNGPGDWVKMRGLMRVKTAADPNRLAEWIRAELWEMELVEPVQAVTDGLVAKRGRLGRRIDAWNDDAAYRFTIESLRRARDHAVAALEVTARGASEAGRADQATAITDAAARLAGTEPGDEQFAKAAADAAAAAHAAFPQGHDPFGGSAAQVLSGAGDIRRENAWAPAAGVAKIGALIARLAASAHALAEGRPQETVKALALHAEQEERTRQAEWLRANVIGD